MATAYYNAIGSDANLVRAEGSVLVPCSGAIETEFWCSDWRPASPDEIADLLTAGEIFELAEELADADGFDLDAWYDDWADTYASARFGFALI